LFVIPDLFLFSIYNSHLFVQIFFLGIFIPRFNKTLGAFPASVKGSLPCTSMGRSVDHFNSFAYYIIMKVCGIEFKEDFYNLEYY
jgi:hypothetical protein